MRVAVFALVTVFAIGLAAADDGVAPPVGVKAPESSGGPPPTELRAKSDETLEIAVSRELADDPRVHAMQIKVAVRQGLVTLTGTAADTDEKQAAEAVARRVSGVRQVENQLVVPERGTPAPGASMIPEVPKPPPPKSGAD